MRPLFIGVFLLTCVSLAFTQSFAGGNGSSLRKYNNLQRLYAKAYSSNMFHEDNAFRQDLTPVERLGKELFENLNLSINDNQSCSSCHDRSAKFADPDNTLAPDARPVSQGSDLSLFGGRNAPTAAYAAFSPKLHWNTTDELFIGGIFWDGRASGQPSTATATGPQLELTEPTGIPLADQAKGPFLNPVEMALTTLDQVVETVLASRSRSLFLRIYGKEIYDGTVLNVPLAYNKVAEAIAAYEASADLNRFNSRFDKFVREQGGDVSQFGIRLAGDFREYVGPPANFKSKYLTYDEADGLALFNADSEVQLSGSGDKVGGMCYLCHLTERHDPDYGTNSTQPANKRSSDGTYLPLLTDFSYDNLGIPTNPRIGVLAGAQGIDLGLGADSRVGELTELNNAVDVAGEAGKFKVSSLRDIDQTPPYGHNGFFPTLYSIVHFYNTRDNTWPGESFPPPEVATTVNGDELGNLGLNFEQEKKLVLFLKTLTDE